MRTDRTRHHATRLLGRGMLAFCVIAAPSGWATDISKPRCLFGTTVGDSKTRVGPCTKPDPLDLGHNEQILKLITAVGVPRASIAFSGCPGDVFRTKPGTQSKYTISYPPEVIGSVLAPVAHELSHVVQLEAAGGFDELSNRYDSLRIELGADYLAGVLFRRVLPDLSRNEFQNHVKLNGLYRKEPVRAHGTPAQRTAAFRLGVMGRTEQAGASLSQLSEVFQEDLYATIISNGP